MTDTFEIKNSEVDKLIRNFLDAEWNKKTNQKDLLEIVAVRPIIQIDHSSGKQQLDGFSVDVNIVKR